MSDLRESFPTLEIAGTQAGQALEAKQEGDAASGYGAIGFSYKDSADNVILAPVRSEGEVASPAVPGLVFKDSSGNLVYPQLDPSGRLPVTQSAPGVDKYARGEIVGNAALTTVATLALTANKSYQGLEVVCSCFRDALFQVIWNDNGSSTVLADLLVGPGSLTAIAVLEKLQFTAGAVGTQQLLLKAMNENALSNLRGSIATLELA